MVHCKKCPFFTKKKEASASKGAMILGFCRLRDKFVSDESITNELCKDRAVVDSQKIENTEKRDERSVITF